MKKAKCKDNDDTISCSEYNLPQKRKRQVHAAFGKDVRGISKIFDILVDSRREGTD